MEMTKNMTRPKMQNLYSGKEFKVIKVTVPAGAQMPEHHATSEAVISVISGVADLQIGSEIHHLKAGDVFLIPTNESHSVKVHEEFKAYLTLSSTGKIEFE